MRRVEIREKIDDYTPQLEGLTEGDHSFIASLKSKKRACEVATWRQLLREVVGEEMSDREIRYSQTGAPYIEGCDHIYIGVSHNARRVAVIISTTEPCAIDIEDSRRDFERVARRYTTPSEVALFGDRKEALAVIWCAKETLIKLAPTRELDLIHDLRILSVESNTIHATCQGAEYALTYYWAGDDVVVYK